MSDSTRPPAYIAAIQPLPLDSESLRTVRLSGRQVVALATLEVPVPLVSPSPWLPVTQAEQVIQNAVADILKGRLLSVVLWQDREDGQEGGDVSVWTNGEWLTVADVTLTPALAEVA